MKLVASKREGQEVWILYKNWRSTIAWRKIRPSSISFDKTIHHPEEQWLLHAIDVEKKVPRSFAMMDIVKMQKRKPR